MSAPAASLGAAGIDEIQDIVLIHGLNSTSQSWSEVTASLPSGLRSAAVDCPALSTVEQIAEALIATLPERFHLVGYSFGGYVALALLELFPERIASMVLMATSSFADTDEQRDYRARAISAALALGHDAASLEQFPKCVHDDHRDNRRMLELYRTALRSADVARYVAHQQACMRRPDRTAVLARALKPLLLITPEADNIVPVRRQLRSIHGIPGAESRQVPGTGHLLPLEAPSAIAGLIADWVGSSARLQRPA